MNVVKELRKIEGQLAKMISLAEITGDENSQELPSFPMFDPNKAGKRVVKRMKTPEEVTQRVMQKIQTEQDAYDAVIEWNVPALLQYDRAAREAICKALLSRCQEFRVKPLAAWQDMLKNPNFYDSWRQDMNDGINVDDSMESDVETAGLSSEEGAEEPTEDGQPDEEVL